MTIAAGLAVALVLGSGHAPAWAGEPAPYKPGAVKPVPKVPVKAAKIAPAPKLAEPPPASARPAPTWPKAASEILGVPAAGARAAQASALPVRVEQPAQAAAAARTAQPAPSRIKAEVLDRATTDRAGVRGVLLRLGRADGVAAPGKAKVTLDYKSFATAYGADWSSRLRLVSLPACALTTPDKTGCGGTPLATDNDVAAKTLSADVSVASASTLVAAEAGPSGPAGDYSATTLNASSTWSAGGNSGDYTWSYPMRVPPSLGGPAPEVKLSYSAQSVDGRHAASNNQPSRVGEGFEEVAGGFIERRYQGCAEDMDGEANNDKKTGDLCWNKPLKPADAVETDNATLSLAGHSGELIYNLSENRWHLRNDDGTRIERRLGATNGDNNGEYWVVTTPDGTQYWFGINRVQGWRSGKPVTNSVLTAPVFGNHPDEPCHATNFIDSSCTQAWRWNLDYVYEPLGNSMSFWYGKSTNKYARNLDKTDVVEYDRESWLERIDYGTRRISGIDSVHNALAPMRVDFSYADRCLSDCDTHNATRWPDVPWDSECTGDTCEDKYSPTFWSTKRLASVTTQVRDGTSYRNVDRWTLTHTFPDPGDGTRAGLWLSKLSHSGLVGGTATMPDVEFTPVQMANRVDVIGDFAPAMNWMRIARIRTETGGTISVVYSEQDCQAGATPTAETNTRRCYPVVWIPEGKEDPLTDWFNKYVVTTVYEQDNTGGVPPLGSPRKVYRYTYHDGAAWHYSDDDGLIKKKYKTWSTYRGYGRVGVTIGDPGEQTYTETRYFRGMNGDRLNANGGVKPVNVDGIADEDWFAGQTRETTVFNGPGGAVVSRERQTPWASGPKATRTINGDTVTARFTGVGSTTRHVTLDGGRGERVTKKVSTFDEYGMVVQVDDLGQDGVAGDEQCIKTNYTPRNTTSGILDRPHSVKSFAVQCSATTGTLTEQQVIGEIRTLYDNLSYGAIPSRGQATQEQRISSWNGGSPTYVTTAKNAYDVHGRVKSTTDALGNATTTTYTPASDGPLTSTLIENPIKHSTSTIVEPAWGRPTATVDANDKRTDLEYDALGQLTAVWKPGRVKGTDTANIRYAYDINVTAPSVVSSSTLNAAGNYVTSYALYDGLLRPRQTQTPSPSGGRIVTENFYDTAGRQFLEYGAYHASGNPGGTLLATSDQAFVPTQTRTIFDGADRPVASIFQPYGRERWRTTTAYGGDRTDTTPPSGATATSTVTDAQGRTVELRQYLGANPTPQTAGSYVSTSYKYDARGYQTRVVDDKGNDWVYTYDIRGQQIQVDDPDRGISKFTYDNLGNQLTSTDARGKTVAYDYDALGRKQSAYDDRVGGVLRAQWIYDTVAKGQLSQSTRFMGSVPYQSKILAYNDSYQPLSTQIIIPSTETGVDGIYNYSATYNVDGSLKSSSIPGTNTGLQPETLTYAYNAFGQPTTLDSLYGSTNQSYVTGTDYDALGRLDQIKLYTGSGAGGRVYTKYSYELETGRLTNIRTDRDSVAPYTLSDSSFHFDNAGKITKIADVAPENADDIQCFAYDQFARLAQAWTPASGDCAAAPSGTTLDGPAPYWYGWTFDAIGNRTSETINSASGASTTGYTYPPSGGSSVRPHAVASTTGARVGAYTYDATGNTVTRPSASSGTQTLTWDAEGHVDTVTDSTGTTSYIYDADGNRLLQRDHGGRTLYLPGQEIRYDNSSATTSCTRYYGHGGATIGSRTRTALTWLSPDHQGTANVAISADNQQATVRRQTPYGTERGTANGVWPNSRGFVGGVLDKTGLTHLGAREYDPANGRFISVDPIQDLADPQQWNGYSYANNNPVTYSDPSGMIMGCGGKFDIPCPKDNPQGRTNPPKPPKEEPEGGPTVSVDDAVISVGDTTTYGLTARGYAPDKDGKYSLGYLAAFASESTQNWVYLCTSLYSRDSMSCELDNPYLPKRSTGQELLLGAIVVGGFAGGYLCGAFPIGCAALIQEAAAGEVAAAGSGNYLGGTTLVGGGAKLLSAKGGSRLLDAMCSFSGDTEVLLADGTTKPLSEVEAGDQVLATDPDTGEAGPRRVQKVWVHDDDLYVLTIDGKRLVTTEDHPFWNETDQRWEGAEQLDAGDLVRTPAGTARVEGLNRRDHRYAAAYNLTVVGIHTYYVLAGNTPVLVHNTGPGCGSLWMNPDKLPHHYMRTSDEGVMHAADFGVSGPYNKANGQAFIGAIERFTKSPGTVQVRGTFRGQDAIHYVDPDTGLHASFAANGPSVGEYLGGWKSGGDQLSYLLQQGKL